MFFSLHTGSFLWTHISETRDETPLIKLRQRTHEPLGFVLIDG